jgi:hypothetical protein
MDMPSAKSIGGKDLSASRAKKDVSEDDRTSVRKPYRVEFKNMPNRTEERLIV